MEKPTDSFKKGATRHSFMKAQSFSKHLMLTGLYDSEEKLLLRISIIWLMILDHGL